MSNVAASEAAAPAEEAAAELSNLEQRVAAATATINGVRLLLSNGGGDDESQFISTLAWRIWRTACTIGDQSALVRVTRGTTSVIRSICEPAVPTSSGPKSRSRRGRELV